jgi:inhibitor of KinA sporulation pathway (predicted exonuclease)
MAEIKYYVFFDFEMLCSDQGMPFSEMEAIRLGAVKYELETETLSYFDRYIKPTNKKPLSKFCKRLTGIKDEDLAYAESFSIIFEDFLTWVGGVKRSQFFSWSKSDISRLKIDAEAHNIALTTIKKIEQRYIDLQAIFSKRVSKSNFSVENALSLYGLQFYGEQHNPMYDALNTFRIYNSFANLRVESDLIMIKQFILGDSYRELDEFTDYNELVKIELKSDIEVLSNQFKEMYRLKDCDKILRKINRLVEKYENVLINRSGIFSKEVIIYVRLFVRLYHSFVEVYNEHFSHSSRVIIFDEHTMNDLKKLSVAI